MKWGAALLTLAIPGCVTLSEIKTACLPMVEYPPATQTAIAAQLGQLELGSPLDLFVQDAVAMRDADRACRALSH